MSGRSISARLHSSSSGAFVRCMDDVGSHLHPVDYELPRVVVVGSRSAGKSSLLELLTGFAMFPRGYSGTKLPVKLKLKRVASPDDSSVTVSYLGTVTQLDSADDILAEVDRIMARAGALGSNVITVEICQVDESILSKRLQCTLLEQRDAVREEAMQLASHPWCGPEWCLSMEILRKSIMACTNASQLEACILASVSTLFHHAFQYSNHSSKLKRFQTLQDVFFSDVLPARIKAAVQEAAPETDAIVRDATRVLYSWARPKSADANAQQSGQVKCVAHMFCAIQGCLSSYIVPALAFEPLPIPSSFQLQEDSATQLQRATLNSKLQALQQAYGRIFNIKETFRTHIDEPPPSTPVEDAKAEIGQQAEVGQPAEVGQQAEHSDAQAVHEPPLSPATSSVSTDSFEHIP